MLTARFVVSMLSVVMMLVGASVVSGQDYPNKPIRIVTTTPGSGNDFIARRIAERISDPLSQPVIVEARPGDASFDTVFRALADGYTLLLAGGRFWLLPLMRDVQWDPIRHFSPISILVSEPNILAVSPSLSVNSVKELIALAKAKPGVLNYSTGSVGGSAHLAGELFKSLTGVDIVRIGYTGTANVITAVLTGDVQFTFASAQSMVPHLKSGKLKALAITPASARYALPTVAASLPGFELVTTSGIFAPAKTPATIIGRLNREIVRALNRADVKETLSNTGLDVVGSSPEQAADIMKSDVARWSKVIKDAGIRE